MSENRWDDCGNYYNPPEPDIGGRDESPYAREIRQQRQNVVRRIMQQIVGESVYKPDMDFEIYHRATELEEQNGLPDGVTAFDIEQEYLRTFEGE